ncbi:hypothetical protein [Billgrantia endophytica]|uniref:Uncharacterized protein n=1 Tax=Billgrantia endophytica TaxID=2033802 RepID=A0A2N7TV95_9GAMM|nr:hypothetical protein [Halomonas endophytica]PMR72100.1 hypothetical protein C1H69_22220 [Halomonas endophytica]
MAVIKGYGNTHAQGIVIVEIFMAQRQPVDTLWYQRQHAVLDAVRVAVTGETDGDPTQQLEPLADFPKPPSKLSRPPSTCLFPG